MLGVLRWLALLAAIAVVFTHLLPESIHAVGAPFAIALFVLGLVLPIGLERLFRARAGSTDASADQHGLGLKLGFWGLVVHHVGDGLVLGAYAHIDHVEHVPSDGHGDVLLALVTHTVPLVAVVASAYAREEGRRAAALRCAGLAVASAVGLLAAGAFGGSVVETFQHWISAGVSGLLLHVAAHDLGATRRLRATEKAH